MREHKPYKSVLSPWRLPVACRDIAGSGQHFDLVADKDVRAAVSRVAGLRDLPRLEANFDVTPRGAGGLHVTGRVSATVEQTCVVTLEPLVSDVEEEIDLLFAPQRSAKSKAARSEALQPDEVWPEETRPDEVSTEKRWSDPEPLIGGVVDLGALATEFLILGLDPYPRKPGAVFEPPRDAGLQEGPFAGLSQLTKGRDGR